MMIGCLAITLFICFLGAIDAAKTQSMHQLNAEVESLTSVKAFLRAGMALTSQAEAKQRVAEEAKRAEAKRRAEADAAAQLRTGGHGLEEVIEVLGQMITDFDTQMMEDKKLWEEYAIWSDTSEKDKYTFMQEQNALDMSETAKQASNEQMVATLTKELGILETEIEETKIGIKEVIQMRTQENQAFEATQADLRETMKAVAKATEILEGHVAADNAQLMQIRHRVQTALIMYGPSRIKSATKKNLMAFASLLQNRQGESSSNFLDATDSKDGRQGVLGMLGDLHSDLQGAMQGAIAREAEAHRQYEDTKAAKETELKNQEGTQAKKVQEKATAEAVIDECISTIDQAKKDIMDAKQFLKQLQADRERFQKEYAERGSVRNDERAATQAAYDILGMVHAGLKEGATLETSIYSLLQTSSKSTNHRLKRVAQDLARIGKQIQSVSLIQIASASEVYSKYSANFLQGPSQQFNPVIKLLTDLVARLEEEAAAETSQHEWCETEKTSSVTAKDERETSITDLKAKINEETTLLATLKTNILFMESELARVKKEMEDAKVLRTEQHDLYVRAKAEHVEVIKAIGIALQALEGQFGGNNVAVFIQVKASQNQAANQEPGQKALFNDHESGAQGAGSAIEMLNDLQSRYESALKVMEQVELDQQKAYEELVITNEQFIVDTTNTRNMKLKERRVKLGQLGDAKSEMKTNLLELHEVNKYLQNLRPSCDDIRSTYEERKKRREAEIAALKEALEVIADPTMMND